MLIIRHLIRETLLLEKKSDDLKAKHPDLSDQIDQLEASVKPKYLEWAVKQLASGSKIIDLIPTLQYFDKNIQKFSDRDINAYTARSLEDKVKELEVRGPSVSKSRKIAKSSGAEKIYEDDEQAFYFIKSREAAQSYGSGTKWCITMKNQDYWRVYSCENILVYFLISKVKPVEDLTHKVAYVIYRDEDNSLQETDTTEVFDAEDNRVQPDQKFLDIAYDDASQRPTTEVLKPKIDMLKKDPEAYIERYIGRVELDYDQNDDQGYYAELERNISRAIDRNPPLDQDLLFELMDVAYEKFSLKDKDVKKIIDRKLVSPDVYIDLLPFVIETYLYRDKQTMKDFYHVLKSQGIDPVEALKEIIDQNVKLDQAWPQVPALTALAMLSQQAVWDIMKSSTDEKQKQAAKEALSDSVL